MFLLFIPQLKLALLMECFMVLPHLYKLLQKTGQFTVFSSASPIQPVQFVILTVGIIISARTVSELVARLKKRDPEKSVASWAFRFAGTFPGVLTVLSGMTLMEHLQDNLRSYCPLAPLSDDDMSFLKDIANAIAGLNSIPCNECDYCMPCPYGIDIPSIFHHYNKCLNEGNVPNDRQDEKYRRARRAYLVSYDRAIPNVRQADHCIGCNQCVSHCPQRIKIPKELHNISEFVENLKRETTII